MQTFMEFLAVRETTKKMWVSPDSAAQPQTSNGNGTTIWAGMTPPRSQAPQPAASIPGRGGFGNGMKPPQSQAPQPAASIPGRAKGGPTTGSTLPVSGMRKS